MSPAGVGHLPGSTGCYARAHLSAQVRVGHALHTVFVDDLDERVESIGAWGIDPASQETYGNGVRKVTYRDPDGNEIGFGGVPLK